MSKPKSKPKMSDDSNKIRKISLPAPKTQSRIPLDELRQNFRRQISLPKEKDIIPLIDPMGKAQESVSLVRAKTGVIFNEMMNEHFNLWDENYPENPERLSCVLKRCRELDLFSKCEVLPSVSATKEQITTLHTESLYNILKSSQDLSVEELKELTMKYSYVYINQKTFDASLLSAGCCIELTKAVLDGRVQNGMALVRPPGHHAMLDEFCGYCLFNNAALAAQFALTKVNKVLIVDWDIHHGQGTQRMFYNNPRVLYISSHRYDNGKFWPHLRESDFDYCGEGDGEGFNFNIPLNEPGMGNSEYLAYFHQVLLPIAYEFCPDVVIISGGYDSALGDQKGMMKVTPAFYSHLTSMLMPLARGKVVALLEGGYYLESLSESAMHTLRTLMGKPCPRLIDAIGAPCLSMRDSILNVIYTHKAKWKCLTYQAKQKSNDDPESEQLDIKLESVPKYIPELSFEGPEPIPPGTLYPIIPYENECSLEEREGFSKELARLQQETSLKVAAHRVCLAYDADMENHCNEDDKNFPEKPARTKEIMRKLKDFGILKRVSQLKSRRAIRSELSLFHEEKFIDLMQEISIMTPRERKSLDDKFISVYFHQKTWDSARLAAGSLLQVVDAVCTGEHQSGIGVIRPPGHHAEIGTPNGFCFFNNVCIAAKYAMEKYSMKRILIVDWDIHHGNGIQHCFESDSSVLYISVHLYKNGNFFPYSQEANLDYVGRGLGRGYNINIPWSKSGMGDGDYISAFTQIILPVAYQFNPDLVLVSAGFDAAVNDPLGGCCVTPECYGHLTHLLSSLANGKLILALEGGYNLDSISYSMTMCAKALLGDPLPPLSSALCPSKYAAKDIFNVITIQKEFWSCLKFQVSFPTPNWNGNFASKSYNNTECSDTEYFTPPTSPPENKNEETKHEELVTDNNIEDDLIDTFSKLSVNSPMNAETQRIDELLEGAVGMDHSSQFTIAQLLQDDDNELHAVIPLSWCPHLSEVNLVPEKGIDVLNSSCEECFDASENWQCLTCYVILCGRYVKKHMIDHGMKEGHSLVLSHSDLSVWCYSCESYIHNEILHPSKQSAYKNKFGEDMPLC